MSIVQGTLPVGSLDHAITLNVQSSGGSHFETVTNTTPYLHRASPQDVASSMKLKKVVGGTIAWNQIAQKGDGIVNASTKSYDSSTGITTITPQYTSNNTGVYNLVPTANLQTHKYYVSVRIDTDNSGGFRFGFGTSAPVVQVSSGGYSRVEGVFLWSVSSLTLYAKALESGWTSGTYRFKDVMCIDLTQMFGSTIADYIYSLEQAHAGDGVAWFKALFGEDYYPYNAGELLSVKTSARKTYNADNVEIGSYALDDNLELRGIPKLDGNNELYYDGDTYASDGIVTRKYAVTDLSSISDWNMYTANGQIIIRCRISDIKTNGHADDYLCSFFSKTGESIALANRECRNRPYNSYNLEFRADGITNTTDWKTYLTTNDVKLVYYLTTPTTESADAYTQSQRVGATEEFVDGRTVEIPVGNVSEYKRLIQEDEP